MLLYHRLFLLLGFLFFLTDVYAQTGDSIKVMFVYGSRPARKFKNVERRWFGGIRGGHVAIQVGPDRVLSFRSTKYNPCHIFPACRRNKYASVYEIRTVHSAWEVFPPHNYDIDSLQRAEVVIPIDAGQRARLDSITRFYTKNVPYDYAVFGIRCASASYDVLSQVGNIVQGHNHLKWLRIFTVRKLRTILFRKVEKNKAPGWQKRFYKGYTKRIWERDR